MSEIPILSDRNSELAARVFEELDRDASRQAAATIDAAFTVLSIEDAEQQTVRRLINERNQD